MKLFYSERQLLHREVREIAYGRISPANDRPERTIAIRDALLDAGLATLAEQEQSPVPLSVLHAVHEPAMLRFLETLHERWQAQYPGTLPFPETSVAPGMRRTLPAALRGQLAYFCFDTCAAVVEGTWAAVSASVAQAHGAALAVAAGERLAFALCRPPGHHAGRDFYGGYCYLNTAAVAAEAWVQRTGTRCAILDVDFHHGNGTQHIFWEREDVFFASLHASPEQAYPFLSGYADEQGAGAGFGSTWNVPLALATTWPAYRVELLRVLERIEQARPEALVVSLGTDTYRGDPVGGLGLEMPDFAALGAAIAELGMPTIVVMEGGYEMATVGECVAQFSAGLQNTITIGTGVELTGAEEPI
ncbi:histone deacetylase family protein [Terriglobus sp.]|uniref:histone deacetylase family protein n=1 Tax=Terriglobus sp. TaxID=1889013 RepID=UPI003B00DED0